jgi:hypothetical protein
MYLIRSIHAPIIWCLATQSVCRVRMSDDWQGSRDGGGKLLGIPRAKGSRNVGLNQTHDVQSPSKSALLIRRFEKRVSRAALTLRPNHFDSTSGHSARTVPNPAALSTCPHHRIIPPPPPTHSCQRSATVWWLISQREFSPTPGTHTDASPKHHAVPQVPWKAR